MSATPARRRHALEFAFVLAMAAVMACLCAMPRTAAAQGVNYRALLVGVSDYPQLDRRLWLKGPRNDVTRMREVLVGRGFSPQNIRVLADGVPGGELPTRQNVMAALDELAGSAKPGDYILIHMSGHGSQEPVPPGSPYEADEPDRLFEVFLPRDVEAAGKQPLRSGAIKNAIIDHEIRAAVDRMTAAGAFVWGIFDTCHSATLVRGAANDDLQLREVTPAELGIQDEVDRAVARAATARTAEPTGAVAARTRATSANGGGSVFFYAAQSTQSAPEMSLPIGDHAGNRHGLFTWTILQSLEAGGAMTYQQLAQQVLVRFGGMAEARATPLFSGTALQTGVLGSSGANVRQWTLASSESFGVPAGELAGIEHGAVFAILPSALARTEDALGYAKAARTDATSSLLEPVAFGKTPAKPLAQLRAGGRVARLVQPALNFEFVVADDLHACEQPCVFQSAIAAMKAAGATGAVPGATIKWARPGETANIKLVAEGRRLWLAPPTVGGGDGVCAAGMKARECAEHKARVLTYVDAARGADAKGVRDFLVDALHAASRAANLMRIAGAVSTNAAATQLKMTVERVTKAGAPVPISASEVSRLNPGDRVRVAFENTGDTSLDVTALYLDSKWGIDVYYPLEPGASNRVEAKARSAPFEIEITDSTLGLERLAVIAVEARRQQERADYSFLAQPTLANQSLKGAVSDTEQVFRDAGFAEAARRGGPEQPATPLANIGMQVYSWQVVPR